MSTFLSSFSGLLIPADPFLVFGLVRRMNLLTLIAIEMIPVGQNLCDKTISSSRPFSPVCQIADLAFYAVAVSAKHTSDMSSLMVMV